MGSAGHGPPCKRPAGLAPHIGHRHDRAARATEPHRHAARCSASTPTDTQRPCPRAGMPHIGPGAAIRISKQDAHTLLLLLFSSTVGHVLLTTRCGRPGRAKHEGHAALFCPADVGIRCRSWQRDERDRLWSRNRRAPTGFILGTGRECMSCYQATPHAEPRVYERVQHHSHFSVTL